MISDSASTASLTRSAGWPADLADEEILCQLVSLKAERAEQERRIGWCGGSGPSSETPPAPPRHWARWRCPRPRPRSPLPGGRRGRWAFAEQVRAVRAALQSLARRAAPAELARGVARAPVDKVTELRNPRHLPAGPRRGPVEVCRMSKSVIDRRRYGAQIAGEKCIIRTIYIGRSGIGSIERAA